MSLPPSSSISAQSPSLKTYFKTPEGRYKLQYEKTHPAGLLHYSHGKAVSQLTIAYLKEKLATQQPTTPTTPSSGGGVRSAAARLLGASNGTRSLTFVGGNVSSKVVSGSSRIGGSIGGSLGSSGSGLISNFDGKGTYLIFNSGDTIFISDLNSQDKDPIKAIHFSNSNPICHAFDTEAKDGHDLLIGLLTGDGNNCRMLGRNLWELSIITMMVQLITAVALVLLGCQKVMAPLLLHMLMETYMCMKKWVWSKDGTADCSFPVIKDQSQFSVAHARSSKSNPIARWHVSQGSINNISFSTDGTYLATVGRDGYLRVFDYTKEQLICGGKSYYGALLCCAWSSDGKYILTGGEDDLVQAWSMEDRKIVAWGEGHNSWVSGVSFDSFWSSPSSDETGENVVYRFASVGQDTQLLLWDLAMDEIAVPLRCPPGGSPTLSAGSPLAHWDNISPVGTLQPAQSMRDVPKLSPLVAHRVHVEPLSGLIFTIESVLTICREGHIKVWVRPGHGSNNSQSSSSETALGTTTSKDRSIFPSVKGGSLSYKQPPPILLRD